MEYDKISTLCGIHCRVDRSGEIEESDVSQVLFPANDKRIRFDVYNLSSHTIYVQDIPVEPNQHFYEDKECGVSLCQVDVRGDEGDRFKAWEVFKCENDIEES